MGINYAIAPFLMARGSLATSANAMNMEEAMLL